MKRSILFLAICVVLAAAGCGSGSDASSNEWTTPDGPITPAKPGDPTKKKVTENKTKPRVEVPEDVSPDEFAYRELYEGTGATAKKGDEVTVQYVGVGYDSEKQFGFSPSLKFVLGTRNDVEGFDRGVEGMKVGGRRELVVPADLAYGDTKMPPLVGPGETLIFVVDLLAIE